MNRLCLLLLMWTAAIAVPACEARANRLSYFNMTETLSEDLVPFPKWTGMESRFDDQKRVPDENCGREKFHPCSIVEWKALLDSIRDQSFHEQLDAVNRWSNDHPYIEDIVNWGIEDY